MSITSIQSSRPVSPVSPVSAETNAEKIQRRLKGKDKAERYSRIIEQAEKMEGAFTKRQIAFIKQVLKTNEPYKGSLGTKEFATRLHGLVINRIQKAIDIETCSSMALEGLTLDKFEKLAKSASPYQVTPLEPVKVDEREVQSIATEFDEGEAIPEYISSFDTSPKHTLNVKKYIDVRVSHTIQETIKDFQKDGKNVEIFIGSVQAMKKYYAAKGYHPVAQLNTNNSNKYMVFASAEQGAHKLVIAGVSNKSRYNNVLMQLKFLGADLEKVGVHGSLEAAMQENVLELRKRLSSAQEGAEPTLAFIGNRSIVFTELAKHLYPGQITAESEEEQEKQVEQLLERHDFRTEDIDKVFKFSSAKININGKLSSVVAFRMPNGSLSGLATQEILRTGYKDLVMVGAGGSLDEHNGGGLGSMQIVERSSYQGQTLALRREQIMPLHEIEVPGADVRTSCSNVTVDGPLEENSEWHKQVQEERMTSVDVETYHIFDAISRSSRDDVRVLPGLFNSDIVGKHPLEDKITANNAYGKFPAVLKGVFKYKKVTT